MSYSGEVSQSSDDGCQNAGGTPTNNFTDASDVLKSLTGSKGYLAFRLQNVTVAPTDTVTAASLSVWVPTGGNTAMNCKIYGNLVANPVTLQATNSYISGLSRTTNSVSWAATLTANQFNASPDLTAIINELIAQGSWASGNAMLFILLAQSSSSGCTVEMYDGSPSEAVELSITTSAPAGSLKRQATMTGLGAGGPFFANPIG